MRDIVARNRKCKLYKEQVLYDDKVVCDIELTQRSPGGWITASKPLVDGDKVENYFERKKERYNLVLDKPLGGEKVFRIKISRIEEDIKNGAFDIISRF